MTKTYLDSKFPFCPTNDFTCPYYGKYTNRCMMYAEEKVLPFKECDNFFEEGDEENEC